MVSLTAFCIFVLRNRRNLWMLLLLPFTDLGAERLEQRQLIVSVVLHLGCNNVWKQPTLVHTQCPGSFVDWFKRFDFVACNRTAFFEFSCGDQDASFERSHALVVRVQGAIKATANIIEMVCKHS